jgi:sugar O-acyltransferase (sialic acid O-acetyltransferase NeuD family)
MTKATYGLIGAGGYAREVMPLIRRHLQKQLESGGAELFFVSDLAQESKTINGTPFLPMNEFLALPGEKLFNVAIADSIVREEMAARCLQQGASPFSIQAENVIILDQNEIGPGAILSPFVTVTSNARIGKFFHANLYSYVAHDCVIGDFVTFAPGVKCNGNVIVEDHVYIGTGACIVQGTTDAPVRIGKGAFIGMGSVVTKSIPPETKVFGNPARPLTKTGMKNE